MRRLSDAESALWAKVIASVRPIHGAAPRAGSDPPAREPVTTTPPRLPARPVAPSITQPARPQPGVTLDGSWDKRLSRGLVSPDFSVDLHGHNLATAYSLLDARLEQAIATGARVLLLVTGKPPTSRDRPVGRGAIRAAVADWLAASRHAGSIAAVRGAHPRHGGLGALYIVLRRRRS
ncbi:Smr/MutS family protein [Allosphingosinicella indica]|uniref:DNA-nicking endonuclease, Smr domain n=1 Tax=Allosphingosinicella indica TaxID=941907 RepID=A0A1X7FZS3_9SPHN|nr:Smr/MutS family protein [Allosphingosinicella indica]SMF61247.1 DNA-nicking endonuclease, Smr domain [Allosphingosinicella indica]